MQAILIGAAPAVIIAVVLGVYIMFLRSDILLLTLRNETMANELARARESLVTTNGKLDAANARVAALLAAAADSVPAGEVALLADGIDQIGQKADQIAPPA